MDSDLLQDVITVVRNQIGQEAFKNLQDTSDDVTQTEKLAQISDLEIKGAPSSESGSKMSEVRMLRMAIQDFVDNMRSELANFDTTLNGARAEKHQLQVTESAIHEMKKATEQIQQYAELYEELQLKSCHLKHFFNTIKATTQTDVAAQSIQFRAKWKAYNILSLAHLLLMTNEYKAAKDASKYVIFWLQQNIGAEARTTNLHGFSCHILAIIHRAQNNYETAAQYYESALDAYRGDFDWIDAKVQKNLIQVIGAKLEYAKRKVNYVEAFIGPEGGRLGLNSCQVQIPQGALSGKKQFILRTSLVENYEKDYAPISAVLECEPPTSFKSPVKIALPTWCEVKGEKVIAKIVCLSNQSSKRELIESVDLQNVEDAITFDSIHFSSFFMMIKKTFLRMVKFKATMNIWNSPEGNYNFILSARDRTVEKKWREDLQSQGYSPTRAIMNPIVVKNKQELTLTMTCDKGNFSPPRQMLIADFFHNPTFHKNFVLNLDKEGSNEGNITVSCTVMSQGRVVEEVRWKETATSTGYQRARLADVFQDEIVKEFSSKTLWRRFAVSSHGLTLSVERVNTMESNYPADLERQKIAMLESWRDITGGSEHVLILKIRTTVEKFREHEQT